MNWSKWWPIKLLIKYVWISFLVWLWFLDERFFYQIRRFIIMIWKSYHIYIWDEFDFFATFIFPDNVGILKLKKNKFKFFNLFLIYSQSVDINIFEWCHWKKNRLPCLIDLFDVYLEIINFEPELFFLNDDDSRHIVMAITFRLYHQSNKNISFVFEFNDIDDHQMYVINRKKKRWFIHWWW